MRHSLVEACAAVVVAMGLLTAGGPETGLAQAAPTAPGDGPRFLVAMAGGATPAVADVRRVPLLRRRVTLALDDASVAEALEAVRRQADIEFVYASELAAGDRRLTLTVANVTVAAALTEILFDAGVDVLVSGSGRQQVTLVPRRAAGVQQGSIAGRVTDAATTTGLSGVHVSLEGTRWQASTDEHGRYRLTEVAPGTHTLTVRRIGYQKQSEAVTVREGEETRADVALQAVPTRLEEVVVTGTVVPTAVKALPTPVDVVTAADLERQQIRRIDQIFRLFVPSAIAWDLGTNPERTTITVRGSSSFLGGTAVKIFVDGVEVASTTFTLIDPNSIERIEVIRGPQAATIYGPDAIGGVMQVFTKKGDPTLRRPQLEAQAAAGLLESDFTDGGTLRQEYEAGLRGGAADFGYNVGASFSQTGEWIPEFHAQTPSVYGSAHLGQGPVSIDLSSRYFAVHQNLVNQPSLVQAGLESPLPRHEELHTRQTTLGARLTYTPTARWRHNVTVGSDGYASSRFTTRPRLVTPDDTLLTVLAGDTRKTSLAYNTSVTLPLASAVSAVVTAGFDHSAIEDNSFFTIGALNFEGSIATDPGFPAEGAHNPSRNTGYFAQAQIGVSDALFLTGGLRMDRSSALPDDEAVSPRLGVAYSLPLAGTTIKLRAAYGEAIRVPDPSYRQGLDFGGLRLLANPALLAERQAGMDAGVDLVWGAGSASATYYRQTARDLIDFAFVGVDEVDEALLYQYQNAGRVRNTGLELQGAVRIGPAELTGNYAFTSSKVLELAAGYLGDARPGDQTLEIPKHTGAATVAFPLFSNTSLSSGLTYVGERTSYDYLAQRAGSCQGRDCYITYDAFTKLNVAVTQALTSKVSALLTVENLTNNNTGEEFNILPSVGRVTTVGVRARW